MRNRKEDVNDSVTHPSARTCIGLRTGGSHVLGWLKSNVRSSLRVSVGFESSVALLVFYAFGAYTVATYIGGVAVGSMGA